jgi:enoyl-[acyl-carrier protein] reductase I
MRGLVDGIANDQSIAWGCAKAFHNCGAELAITYLNEKAEPYVRPLAQAVGSRIIMPLDLRAEGQLEAVFEHLAQEWESLDFLLHAVAFAPKEDLQGRVTDCSREGFLTAMDISVYSLIQMARLAEPLMKYGGSIQTLTFLGSQRAVENYNIMGPAKAALESVVRYLAVELAPRDITVNAISPGPIATRAASGIKDFNKLTERARMCMGGRELASIEDVGALAAFLASPGARRITGGVHYVDGGFHMMD